MKVIVFEEETYYKTVEETIRRIKEKEKFKDNKWINENEACEMLGIKKFSLGKLRTEGKIRFSQPSRKVIKYDRNSILKYLEDNAVEMF